MPYKTLSIKLLEPTNTKKIILEDALERYTKAFHIILEEVYEAKIMDSKITKSYILKLLNKDIMDKVDFLKVEPFKDALRMDVTMTLTTYFTRKATSPKINYPVIRTTDDDIKGMISELNNLNMAKINFIFDKYEKRRPILFSRFAHNRDYTLLKDIESNRYYVKLYLFNRNHAVKKLGENSRILKYISSPEEFLQDTTKKIRYELFPLSMGQWQEHHLSEVEAGIAIPKSAQLIKRGNKFYFNLRLWYEPSKKISCNNFLGVVRGINEELFYVICNGDGKLVKSGSISAVNVEGKNKLHELANTVVRLAKENRCVIILENLANRNDRLKQKNFNVPISVSEYSLFADLVSYKAELTGIDKPVKVSPSLIFFRCPICDTVKFINRFEKDKFLCIGCGNSERLELVGAKNLATTLIRYRDNKIQVYYRRVEGEIIFILKLLNLEYECKDDEFATEKFYIFLRNFISTTDGFNKKQSSIIKKLKSEENIKNCIRYTEIH